MCVVCGCHQPEAPAGVAVDPRTGDLHFGAGAARVSVPGMRCASQHTRALVEFVDIYPTLCELAGLPVPAHVEGLSFKPLLDAPDLPWKSAVFSQYPRPQQGGLMGYSMRTDRYRFTQWLHRDDHSKVDSIELYDHGEDPHENQNLAARAEKADLIKALATKLAAGWKAALPRE